MKVTDPGVIKTGEKELIDAVKQDLDWDAVKQIVTKRISMASLEAGDGEIVVHNNQIAFKVALELNMPLSLLFDRDGNYIDDQERREEPETNAEQEDLPPAAQVEEPGAENGVDTPPLPAVDEETDLSGGDDPGREGEDADPAGLELDGAGSDLEQDLDSLDDDLDEFDLSDFEDEDLDEDIDDILKESKEFWDQKKEE
ncbi:MAG TPA: hypothetical protein VJ936_02630 [Desulfobacteraceae bacterium]|nr:hypothetical protein [Desulfobacteraceae bacterium]